MWTMHSGLFMVNPRPIHCRAYSGDKIIHSAIKCRNNNIGPIAIFELLFSTKKSIIDPKRNLSSCSK